jgi:hypothetical protein
MKKLSALAWSFLGLSVLAASLLMSSGQPGVTKAQNDTGPLPVNVVNNPLNVQLPPGPMDVNVTGLPAVQIGDPNIKSGLGVLEVREAARKPFAFWEQFEFKSPAQGPQIVGPHHIVGPDRWVVLNYANLQGCSQPKEDLSVRLWVSYDYSNQGLGAGNRALQLITNNLGVFMEPEGRYNHVGASMPMNLYIQPGAEFWFEIWRSGVGERNRLVDDAKIAGWISGYSVPAEQFTMPAGGGVLLR